MRKKRKISVFIFTFILFFSIFSGFSSPVSNVEASGTLSLSQLREKFPAGKYWNHAGNPGASNSVNNQDGYTSTPCSVHGVVGTSQQTCNGFAPAGTQLSWQCMGYAEKLGYDATGYNPRENANGWYTSESVSALDNLKPGDIVRYKDNVHSIYVTGVNGDTVTYTDCNSDNHCLIRWDQTISKSTLASTFSYVRSGPGVSTSYNPQGSLDGVSGGEQSITLCGWAFDLDQPTTALEVHVYIGGEAGSGVRGYKIMADQSRTDVGSAYSGVGDNHGFSATLTTELTGSQPVYVYAINVADGTDTLLHDPVTVNIAADTTKPTISNVTVTNKSATGYTVNCNVSDNVGVTSVVMRTWTNWNGEWKYRNETLTPTSNTISHRVNVSDFDNQSDDWYQTDIYVYDSQGNYTAYVMTPFIVYDDEPPVISDVTISDKSATGYTVSCNLSDNTGLTKVVMRTWTNWNGNWNYSDAEVSYDNWRSTYRVNVSDFDNESEDWYQTDIYAYDTVGNCTSYTMTPFILYDDEPPVISNVVISDKSETGYTVSCNLSDNTGLTKVIMRTWTNWNDGWNYTDTEVSYDNWHSTYRVNVSDFDNESNDWYQTDILAYDSCGNLTKYTGEAFIITEEESSVENPFSDVTESAWYASSVQYVYEKGLMSGNNGLFNPSGNVTRAQLVSTLYKLAGSPTVTDYSACDELMDVEKNQWYTDAVCWTYSVGVANGNSSTMMFNMNDPVTRQQLATFFYNYAEYNGLDTTAREDISDMIGADEVASYALDTMQWAVGTGLISGSASTNADGTTVYKLNPKGTATRAQLASILMRFCDSYDL